MQAKQHPEYTFRIVLFQAKRIMFLKYDYLFKLNNVSTEKNDC